MENHIRENHILQTQDFLLGLKMKTLNAWGLRDKNESKNERKKHFDNIRTAA